MGARAVACVHPKGYALAVNCTDFTACSVIAAS